MATDSDVFVKPWDWRRGYGWCHPGASPDVFHAYDVNGNAACEPIFGLGMSRDQPNEGSEFCDKCIATIKAMPAGRARREMNRDG